MHSSRRNFIKTGARAAATTAAALSMPRPLLASFGGAPEQVPPIQDSRIKALTLRGVDVARSADAEYADVRLTHERRRDLNNQNVNDHEELTASVRALVGGYWGFASGPVWTPDEMARLGREAVAQAKTNTLGKPRIVELAPTPVVSGHWATPVKIDPFEVYPVEIQDYLQGLIIATSRIPYAMEDLTRVACYLFVQDKAFGSSNGSYYTQRIYRTKGSYSTSFTKGEVHGGAGTDLLTPAGQGWEMFRDQPLVESLRQASEVMLADMALPLKAVDVGRYDVVFDAGPVTELLSSTIGAASEIDRAMGFEANAGGTSYLSEPLEMLGAYKIGTPLLNVTGNRSQETGAATVQWDDEGVVPDEFTIVKDGILNDYQTTREGAGWIQPYYAKLGASFRSHGCASAPSALESPLPQSSNLAMRPGSENLNFDSLVGTLAKGVAFRGMNIGMDFQQLNGMGYGMGFEIKNGKRVARLAGAGILFRAPELWKSLTAIGGPNSVRRWGVQRIKGEPPQSYYATVSAVPAAFKEATIIDYLRKA